MESIPGRVTALRQARGDPTRYTSFLQHLSVHHVYREKLTKHCEYENHMRLLTLVCDMTIVLLTISRITFARKNVIICYCLESGKYVFVKSPFIVFKMTGESGLLFYWSRVTQADAAVCSTLDKPSFSACSTSFMAT